MPFPTIDLNTASYTLGTAPPTKTTVHKGGIVIEFDVDNQPQDLILTEGQQLLIRKIDGMVFEDLLSSTVPADKKWKLIISVAVQETDEAAEMVP